MAPTISDIARHLNVSNSTVSKALNGYVDVSDSTREMVVSAARELGYQPSAAARNLRRGRTDKIGLFLNTSLDYVADYLSKIIPTAVLSAQETSRNLLIYTLSEDDPDYLLNACRAGEIDGVVLFSTHYDQAVLDQLIEDRFPFVVMGREIDDPRVAYVVPDNYTGAYQATRHLIELGHRRIAFTTRPELTTANEARFTGYKDALTDAGIELDDALLVETLIIPDSGIQPAKYLLDLPHPPSAIFAFHDLVAADVIEVAQDRGIRVPDELSVMGFDGLRAGLMTTPKISTVSQPLDRIGQRVIEVIDEMIASPDAAPVREQVPVELIIRESTAPLANADI